MSNDFDTIRTNLRASIASAEAQQEVVDENVRAMAGLVVGRLRIAMPCGGRHRGSYDTLRALKNELRNFDLTTGKWKD